MQDTADLKVRRYAAQRYRGIDQRIVNALESRLICRYLDDLTQPGDSVLDMPCGYGRFTEVALARGLRVTVGDIKPAMISYLRERLGQDIPGECLRSDALPHPDKSFDVSLCIRLMQHLHDPGQRRKTLCELARMSRRGVILTVYTETTLHRWIHSARRLKRLSRYDEAGLAEDLAASGLRIADAGRPIPFLHAQQVLKLIPA